MNDIIESWTEGDFSVTVTPDLDTKPGDMGEEAIARWRADHWHFVVIAVTPIVHGETLRGCTAYLGGCAWGELTKGQWIGKDDGYIRDAVQQLIPAATANRDQWLTEVREAGK